MLLLSFEGIDGSGKSTQARLLERYLRDRGRDPLLVREPGGTELSERVRTLLLQEDLAIDPLAEMLLFSAARAQLVADRVRPALQAGRIVLCDRFYDSTTAYQGGGRQLADPDWLNGLHRRVTQGIVPDRTYLIELPPSEAQTRRTTGRTDPSSAHHAGTTSSGTTSSGTTSSGATSSGADPSGADPSGSSSGDASGAGPSPADDRMETEDHRFYRRVADAYARLADAEPERFLRLDGRNTVDHLHKTIRADVRSLLKEKTDR